MVAVLVTAWALAVPGAPVTAAADPLLTMPDGQWLGSLIYNSDVSFGGGEVLAEVTAYGTFTLAVVGGTVTGGTMEAGASGFGVSSTAGGQLTFTVTGSAAGTAAAPLLVGNSSTISGEIVSEGMAIPVNLTFGASDIAPIPLEIFAVTCEQVTGDFSQVAAAMAAEGGGVGEFVGRFTALRGDDPLPDDAIGALEQLITDAESISNAAKAGQPIDTTLLLDALDRAEALAASIPVNVECRNIPGPLASAFVGSLAMVIADLIAAVVANPTGITLATLQAVVEAGVRMGVLSANAPAGSEAESLAIQLEAEFDLRLDAAIGPPFVPADVAQILATAKVMGWSGVAAKAEAALAGAGGWRAPAATPVVPGIPTIVTTTSGTGLGARPVLRWEPAAGAASYLVGVVVPAGGPLWAWRGAGPEVAYGGGPVDDPDTTGAWLTQPAEWFVVAFDAAGAVVGVSAPAPIAP